MIDHCYAVSDEINHIFFISTPFQNNQNSNS
jgi:hypothetical protein